jgi:uncharacterized protein YcfL
MRKTILGALMTIMLLAGCISSVQRPAESTQQWFEQPAVHDS